MSKNPWIVFLTLAVVGSGAVSLAQTTTATLTGTVTDPNNAAIRSAQVQAVENVTGVTHKTRTNDIGEYVMPALPPGVYTVSVSAPGFAKTSAVTTLTLQQTQRLDVILKVGAGSNTITVSAAAQQLQTETHHVSNTLSSVTVQSLPSVNSVIQTLTTTPNFSQDTTGQTAANNASLFFGVGSLSASTGGLAYGYTEFLQDGVVNTSLMTATANMQPDVEGVSEVSVTQNGADARYSSPSVVNIITKSGTNRVHGMAYDFIQNDDLNAQGEIKQAVVPPLRYNQFGANVGGPFIKNKLFYFLDYSGLRDSTGTTLYAWVPTAAESAGDFSADPYTIYDPSTYNPATGAISPFPGNKIPANRISQIATAVESYLPAPSSTPTGVVTANFAEPAADTDIYNSYVARLDGVIGAKDNFYAAYESTNPETVIANFIPANSGLYIDKDTNAYGEETHVVSPQLVNIVRVGYNRNNLQETAVSAGTAGAQNYLSQFGIPILDPAPEQRAMPGVGATLDNGSFGVGASAYAPQGDIQHLLQFDDEVNWTRGKHALFFGGEVRHVRFQGDWVVFNNGAFQFNGQFTSDHTAAGLATEAAHGFADLLLGYPWYVLGATGNSSGDFREYDLQPYIQDNWHVSPKLTLNLGLRYDFYQSPWDRNGHASTYDIATNTIHFGAPPENYGNFDPRVGFAYALPKQSTIHGGYGYYDAPIVYDELFFEMASPPNFYLQGGLPPLANPTPIANIFVAHPTGSALEPYVTAPKMPTQRVEQWNLQYEKAIGSSWIASLAYLGSKATHQEVRTAPNMANQALTPGEPQVRPYPWVGDVYEVEDIGFAFYNGLVAQINRRFHNGLFFNASYTYMHSKDSGQDNTEHANDPGRDYALSDFNVTNTYKVNVIYELPFGPGKPFLNRSGWLARELAGGWQVSGIFSTRSGYPFNAIGIDNSGTGANHAQYADQIAGCDPNSGFRRSKTEWFNTACFVQPPVGRLGNEPRNNIHGPRRTNTDLSAFKSFAIRDGVSMQYRADFFNAFNQVNYNIPSSNISLPASFGHVIAYGPARTIQMSLKLIF